MDHSEDVERLFSWIKAPMVRYREFSPQVEVAEASATWPLAHAAAVQTGLVPPDAATPRGDSLAHQRIARDRMSMPELAAKAIQDAPPPGTVAMPAANAPRAMPSSDRLVAALGQRVQAANAERAEAGMQGQSSVTNRQLETDAFVASAPLPPDAPREPLSQREALAPAPAAPVADFDDAAEPPAPPRGMPLQVERPRELYRDVGREPAPYSGSERGALFGSEHRGREHEVRRPERPADRQRRSLDAVFNRLSGNRDRLPDPRNRSRTTPGAGGVFGRSR
jgi:hypothetical protein